MHLDRRAIACLLVLVVRAAGPAAADELTVVCLGDSITKGVSTDGGSVPYPEHAQELLGEGVRVVNLGFPSAHTAYLRQEFPRQVAPLKPAWVIVLAGVNDVNIWDGSPASLYAPQQVIGRLRELGAAAAGIGARTMYLTFWPDEDFSAARLAAVRQINTWILDAAGREIPKAVAFDAAKTITASPGAAASGALPALHDGSHLHLNADGHRRLAADVVSALRLHLPAAGPSPSAARAAAPAKTLDVDVPRAGPVSLALYDAGGVLVRTLWNAAQKPGGKQQAAWDLLDDEGQPVRAGAYTYHTINGAPVKPRYIATLANGRRPWEPGDLGNVEALNLFDVVVDGDGTIYSSGGGHGRTVQRISPDGRQLEAAVNVSAVEVASALALSDEHIFVIGDDGFYRLRKADMKFAKFPNGDLVIRFESKPKYWPPGAKWDKYERLRQEAEECKRPDGSNDPRTHAWRGIMRHPMLHYEGERIRGAAVWDGRLLIPDYHYDEIRVYDTVTGARLQTWGGIEDPGGIAVSGPDIYAVSGRRIVALDAAGTVRREVVGEHLVRPSALAVGPDGNLYVTDLGIPNRVKVFSPGGELLQTFGSDEPYHGRVRHDKLGIPRGIAVDREGNIILAEFALNRVQKLTPGFESLWDLQALYCYLGTADQTRPRWVYGFEGPTFPTIRQYSLDYETGQWEWTRVWYCHKFDDAYSFYGYPSRGGGALTLDGRKFLYIFHKGLRIYRIDNDDLMPVVRFGPRISFTKSDGTRVDYMRDWKTVPKFAIWQDLNHDTRVTEDEMRILPDETAARRGLRWDSTDANITADGTVLFGNMVFALQGLADGIPRYDWDHMTHVSLLTPEGEPLASHGIAGVGIDDKGNRYYGTRDIRDGAGDFGGMTFWAKRAGRQYVDQYTPEGKRMWRVGRKAHGKVRNGEFSYMTCLDWAGGFVFVGDMDGYVHVYTDDGLFVTRMFRGTREGADQGTDPGCITSHELGHVRTFDHPGNGKTYLVSQSLEGGEHVRVYEIEGLADAVRSGGAFEVTSAELAGVRPRAAQTPAPKQAGPRSIAVTSVLAPPVVDGSLDTWTRLVAPVEVSDHDGSVTVKALLRYDEKYLYLGAQCAGDNSPAMNVYYPDEMMNVWKGDCFNLFINTDPRIDRARKKYGKGDTHLFFPLAAAFAGKPLRPYRLQTRDVVADAEYRLKVDPGQGWSLTGRIPWTALGDYYPVPGDELHLNFQVDFANPQGTAHLFSLSWGGRDRSYADPSAWNGNGKLFYAR